MLQGCPRGAGDPLTQAFRWKWAGNCILKEVPRGLTKAGGLGNPILNKAENGTTCQDQGGIQNV